MPGPLMRRTGSTACDCGRSGSCVWAAPVATGRLAAVETDSLAQVAALLRERNAIDVQLAQIMNRPMTSGHLGEWIATRVFDVELEASAVAAGIDGCFRSVRCGAGPSTSSGT
jgi:hypothetical protein